MSIHKTYAVFGLGRYGSAVAGELCANGAEVIAVDRDEAAVENAIPFLPVCKCADVTDPEVIANLGIANVDAVVIAMAGSMEASIMATMLCKEAGVPTVIAKCCNEMHGRILNRVGADKVVFPENESGKRLARNLLSSGFIDMAELSDQISIVELTVRDEWIGKSLAELRLRQKYDMNVIAFFQDGCVSTVIDPVAPISADQKLIVVANTQRLQKLK